MRLNLSMLWLISVLHQFAIHQPVNADQLIFEKKEISFSKMETRAQTINKSFNNNEEQSQESGKVKQKVKLVVEIADTQEKQSRGLMFRKHLSENEGMLFIFTTEEIRNFWMKNTFIPLSIAFVSTDFKIVDIQDMQPSSSIMVVAPATAESKHPAKFAVEANLGWFNKNKIHVGDVLNLK